MLSYFIVYVIFSYGCCTGLRTDTAKFVGVPAKKSTSPWLVHSPLPPHCQNQWAICYLHMLWISGIPSCVWQWVPICNWEWWLRRTGDQEDGGMRAHQCWAVIRNGNCSKGDSQRFRIVVLNKSENRFWYIILVLQIYENQLNVLL